MQSPRIGGLHLQFGADASTEVVVSWHTRGYGAYQTYFALPDSGSDPEMRGLWYAFTAGSVRVISLQNDDICYQDGGNSYVRGYSGVAQKRWLERELDRTRSNVSMPIWAYGRTGCRCSTASASISWSAATSITTSAATPSGGRYPPTR